MVDKCSNEYLELRGRDWIVVCHRYSGWSRSPLCTITSMKKEKFTQCSSFDILIKGLFVRNLKNTYFYFYSQLNLSLFISTQNKNINVSLGLIN